MKKEVEFTRAELEPFAGILAKIFIQRRDLYARQLDDGRYVSIQRPLSPGHLIAHLKGDLTLGTYVLDQDSRARYIVFDADDETQLEKLSWMASRLDLQGATSYLEHSRRGGHLWLFFDGLFTGEEARDFGAGLATTFGLEEIELFPKQSQLKDGPGSLVRLPFGVHRRTGQRYGFYEPNGQPLAPRLSEQIIQLGILQTVPAVLVAAYRSLVPIASLPNQNTGFEPAESLSGTLSERVKASVAVADFVGRYVQLSANGRGLCPFHEDQHMSFSVNAERNYWHCFSGCGGGSIIDFWMKRQDCDFRAAVKELAEMLLS